VGSGKRESVSGRTINRPGEAVGAVGRRLSDKKHLPQGESHGAGGRRQPGDVGDEAPRSLLVSAYLQGLKVVCPVAVTGSDCRKGLVKGERKDLQEQESQQETADKRACP